MNPLILIADDDMDNRAIMSASLTAAGFRILLAQNGMEAIDKALQDPPDLILLDLSMPVMDGYAAARILKADLALAHIPVFALTAFALAGDEAKARAAGCDGYITKPCIPQEVVGRVRAALAAREDSHARRNQMP